jgi:hypothetical protein
MRKKTLVFLTAALFFIPTIILAEQGQRHGRGLGQGIVSNKQQKAFHQQQKAKKQEYLQQQRQKNMMFREILKDKTPQEKAAAIKEYHEARRQEKQEFRYQRRQEFKNQRHQKDKPEDMIVPADTKKQ